MRLARKCRMDAGISAVGSGGDVDANAAGVGRRAALSDLYDPESGTHLEALSGDLLLFRKQIWEFQSQ